MSPDRAAVEADPAVARWQAALAGTVGLEELERRTRLAELGDFCLKHSVSPSALVGTWQEYPELTVRRRPGAVEPPNLAVESFLIHNGVMVFGDLVCVPGANQADLADQGVRFTRAGGAR